MSGAARREEEPGRPGGRVTLRDVAREAGVSIKTVSRVVNGEREVNPETAARVSEVLSRLRYRPNELARSLKGRRSRTIGLMIADISNPFYSGCAKAVEEVARERGYAVILCASAEDAQTEREYVDLLIQRRVEGLLLVPAADGHEYLRQEQTAGLAVVALDRPIAGLPTDAVIVQNRAGTRRAVQHLIEHGHRRIAFVGAGRELYTTRKRLEGYREALREAGLEELVRLEAPDAPSAAGRMRELLALNTPPTAVFAANNLITLGALQALEQAGARVPEDVALVGFDDFALAAVLRPRLTLVRQPADELGRRAARLLIDRLENKLPPTPRRTVLPTELIIRESCGCQPNP
ncbi:LacI family DNA-binding transcriptional regulator [Rubrobacter xylanophilus]|uniref:LacI family DNA-binding transcriptional regulator n=1 Tax=Rubrobacter xylanophilus TaxID=49319 RepID=UPI00117A8C49|nr:LacI family DNA-binding transcriptional regulator [Rubrobacter xylanophilus]